MREIKEDLTFIARNYFGDSAIVSGDGPYVLQVSDTVTIDLGLTNLHSRELLRLISLGGPSVLDSTVTIARDPRRDGRSTVRIRSLSKFRHDFESGGERVHHDTPEIYATISCADIPEASRAQIHSCVHGKPPHYIKVCVVEAQEDLFDVLTRLALWNPFDSNSAFRASQLNAGTSVSEVIDSAISALQNGDLASAAALLRATEVVLSLPPPFMGYFKQVSADVDQGNGYAALEALREARHWLAEFE